MEFEGENSTNVKNDMFEMIRNKNIFRQAADYAYEYMNDLMDRRVFPDEKAIAALSDFNEPMPLSPGIPDEIIRHLHEKGSPATVAHAGGRYFGFVNGGAVPVAVAAKWLSTVWDQNAALYVISPVLAKLEEICEKWLIDLFGLPEGTGAGFVTGTSIATFCGLAAGRNAVLRNAGWNVGKKGLFNAPKIRVIAGEEAHATVFKALSLLGMGIDNVELVPTDEQGRMISEKVPPLDESCLVILQAGNVNSGSFDPIYEICSKAKKTGAWIHVDGAFGLWAACTERKKNFTAGIELADSWSVDGHKTLNTPYDCGIVLCRNKEDLASAMQASASYIIYSENRDNMLLTPDMSRRGRAVELWATLKFLGKRGIAEMIDGFCDHALTLADMLKKEGFQILNDVVFNQVLVSCGTSEETRALLSALQNSGDCWCGGAVWKGVQAIRMSICSWATTEKDIEKTVAAFIKMRKQAALNG